MDTSRGIIAALSIGLVAFAIDYSLGKQALFSPGASTLALVLGALAAIWVSDVESGGKRMTTQVMPIAIVLLGFGLDLDLFFDPGNRSDSHRRPGGRRRATKKSNIL